MAGPSAGRMVGLSLLLAASTAAAGPAPLKEKSLAIVPGKAAGPGEPVPDAKAEKQALAAIASLASPQAKPPAWTSAICSPAFWKALRELDPALASKGTPTQMVAGPPGSKALEGRTFLQKPDGIAALLASPGFRKLMSAFASGAARAATREERALIYSLIPFEIKGKPATVVVKGSDILFINAEGGGLWLDIISAYGPNPAAVPADSVPAESASPAESPEILDACSNEISLLCNAQGSDLPAAAKCLRSQPESLLSPCRKALGL